MTAATTDNQILTRNQALVYGVLDAADGPLSAYDILDLLRDDGIRAPQQVYRALDKLLQFGLIHRLESLNAFVACSHPIHETHSTTAFAICQACGNVSEFSDAALAARLQGWAGGQGFRIKKSTIEVRGLCDACAAR